MSNYVIRGGSWNFSAWNCRERYRFDFGPDNRYYVFGFRLIKKLKQ